MASGKPEKAKIYIDNDAKEVIDCLFNPNSYTITYAESFEESKENGAVMPNLQYMGPAIPSFTVELFFDTYMTDKAINDKEDVRKYTDKILKAMTIDPTKHHPPIVTFVWGSLSFQGVITSATHNFIMFLENGKPVRAKINLTMMAAETDDSTAKANPLESPDRTKQRSLNQNEAIWMLAHQEYKDPGKWKIIAEANNITNPRKIKPGQQFKVPSIK